MSVINDEGLQHVWDKVLESLNLRAYKAHKHTGDDIFIKSSTEGSTKMFKIIVDDNGTITATEV